MKIAIHHDALIPPPNYGGTERAIFWLCQGLRELGHEITLLARPGSRLGFAEVVEVESGSRWEQRLPPGTELLHLFGTPARPPRLPYVVTIEGNGRMGEVFHPNTIFVSRDHAANHGSRHFVYNGLDLAGFRADQAKEDFVVFLAKASWNVKNLSGAISVARAAGLRIEILGSRNWPLGLQRALPTWRGVKYRGMVGDAEKREVLARARGLVFPVRWREPFGIALTEALASGCFVLGTPYGSLPEIVTPAVGALSPDGRVLAQALRERDRFDPAACRQRVIEGRFTYLDMARAYVGYYERVLASGRLSPDDDYGPAGGPGLRPECAGRELLPWASATSGSSITKHDPSPG